MWRPATALPEVILRVTIVYVALLVLIRIGGKRDIGQLGPLELLAMLILSETVSPALTAEDASLTASLTASATLLLLTGIVGRLKYRSRRIERWIEGGPVVLVRDGKLVETGMRKERITLAELDEALRHGGLERLDEVALAVAEQDGRITVVERRS